MSSASPPPDARPIPFVPGYMVTPRGEVWSERAGRLLRPWTDPMGYPRVGLSTSQGPKKARVHRLVALCFLQPASGPEVRHLDGNPSNNLVENLAWGTHAENMADVVRHGRTCKGKPGLAGDDHPLRKRPWLAARGERVGRAKLTAEKVREIRRRRKRGETQASVAKVFGVSREAIRQIDGRHTWRHVED